MVFFHPRLLFGGVFLQRHEVVITEQNAYPFRFCALLDDDYRSALEILERITIERSKEGRTTNHDSFIHYRRRVYSARLFYHRTYRICKILRGQVLFYLLFCWTKCIFKSMVGQCWFCGVEMEPPGTAPRSISRDHLTPRSRGGTNDTSNVVKACRKCNGDKGGLTLEEYRAVISLRFGVAAKFWGEGHKQQIVHTRPTGATHQPMKTALMAIPRFRPVDSSDPHREIKHLPSHLPSQQSLFTGATYWDECPNIDVAKSASSELTGRGFGRLRVVGIMIGVTSPAKFACQCKCGRIVARSAKAIQNPDNTIDACPFCRGYQSGGRLKEWIA